LRRAALVVLATLALAGCHTVRFDGGRQPSQRRWEKTVNFWLWGFKGDGVIDLDAACPEGVASFRSRATALGWVAQVITIGFWSPRQVTVVCAEAHAPRAGDAPAGLSAAVAAGEGR
jgi:hypothetical protein